MGCIKLGGEGGGGGECPRRGWRGPGEGAKIYNTRWWWRGNHQIARKNP